ncbi:C-type lectin domain family 4 member A-like isoform X3 [Pithys albifrons albifrons]|uniref:C-type lectin domain family 4 member A-like isoform X3 n=1 Tax=Pithys albifrons albifrons TaxID=3385563 RepID=UPI003A5CD3C1
MASEITYAEVKFNNASPAAVVEAPPEMKKNDHHPQKYPPWLPWLISLLLLLACIALAVVLLVTPFSCSSDQPTALQEKFTAWQCDSVMSQGKGRGWMCCPKGWKRSQKSCYFLSPDALSWVESGQNCTGMGSHLAVINSREEQVFLSDQIRKTSKYVNFYIGLRARSADQWQWVDKTPYNASATFWRENEPSDSTVEPCVVMHAPEKTLKNWNDIKCEKHNRICEAAAVTV